jgi:GAF domain-containing protein
MAAPMQDDDQVVGVIDLESDRVGGFTPADLALLEQLAAEAARVMQRLWQVGHLKDKARQLESLITAGQSLVTKLEQQALFDTITREARTMVQARACALYLHDPGTDTVRCASLTDGMRAPPAAGKLPLESCLVASPIHTRRQIWFQDIRAGHSHDLRRRSAGRNRDLHRPGAPVRQRRKAAVRRAGKHGLRRAAERPALCARVPE